MASRRLYKMNIGTSVHCTERWLAVRTTVSCRKSYSSLPTVHLHHFYLKPSDTGCREKALPLSGVPPKTATPDPRCHQTHIKTGSRGRTINIGRSPVIFEDIGPLGLAGMAENADEEVEPSGVDAANERDRYCPQALHLLWLRVPPASSLLAGLKKRPHCESRGAGRRGRETPSKGEVGHEAKRPP